MADEYDDAADGHAHGGHDGHSHGVSPDADRRQAGDHARADPRFMAFEGAVGVIAGSLALLSDAAHMLTDAAAIGLSLLAAPGRSRWQGSASTR